MVKVIRKVERFNMPFKSKKQRDFLKINNPTVYKNWVAKHGVAIKKQSGSKLSLRKPKARRNK
jgi:hypothetical protein